MGFSIFRQTHMNHDDTSTNENIHIEPWNMVGNYLLKFWYIATLCIPHMFEYQNIAKRANVNSSMWKPRGFPRANNLHMVVFPDRLFLVGGWPTPLKKY